MILVDHENKSINVCMDWQLYSDYVTEAIVAMLVIFKSLKRADIDASNNTRHDF